MARETVGYIIVDRSWRALELDAESRNHFWLMGDTATIFPTRTAAWNAVRRFNTWLKNYKGPLDDEVREELESAKPLRITTEG